MVEFQDISKSFSGVPVLRRVSLTVPPGQTLGLVGENGAGKSTLMNILGGNLAPDSGRLVLNGRPFAPRHATDAARQGIAFIHQELNLFPNLTIAENLFLTGFPKSARLPWIDRPALRQLTAQWLRQVGLRLPPDTPLERLSPGERQLVEIAKALAVEARLIIFDEPTTSLGARETEDLFALIARLRAQGISMIYISHTLSDVLRVSDEIVVLRDGEAVAAGARGEFSADRLISLMVGRSLTQLYPERANRPSSEVALEVRQVTQPGIVRDISFQLRRGEILGLSGLMGAGRSELARILFGLDPCARGQILLNGAPIEGADPASRIARGLAFLTENRHEEGLCLEASIAENIALASLRQHARPPLGWINASTLRSRVASLRQAVSLTPTAGDTQPARTLSGGNQQKVVLAKWLLAQPSVLILDEPTRGIDVGAKFEVYRLILQLADQGTGILMISSELEELIGICDRLLVMSHGEIRDELAREHFDRERVLRAALRDSKAT